jgi:hypothetical protein
MLRTIRDCYESEVFVNLAMSPVAVGVMLPPISSPGLKDATYWFNHLATATSTWFKSAEFKKLTSCMNLYKLDTITKVVCFGLGDLSRDEWYFPEDGPRAALQHAAAMTVARLVKEKTGNSVLLYSQEPYYFEPVKQVVKEQGFMVYEGAGCSTHGYVDVDENTIVVSISPNVPVRSIIADIARPAVMICDGYLKGTMAQREAYWRAQGRDAE